MKKLLTIILALCLAACVFTACGKQIDDGPVAPAPAQSGDQPVVTTPTEAEQPAPDSPATPEVQGPPPSGETWNGYDIGFVKDNGLDYIWNQLSDEMKTNVAQMMNAIRNFQFLVELDYGVPYDQRMEFLQFIYYCTIDYPYIGNNFSVNKNADGDDTTAKVIIIPYNTATVATEQEGWAMVDELNAELDRIIAGMPDGTEWERIKYLHDYLVFNTTYTEDAKLPFTAYGAIVEHCATCQGYADAMHLLLARAGFETCFAVGRGEDLNQTHKWNYVRLSDGNWYVVDPTWADPTGQDDPDYICYDYFMISDDVLLQDHAMKFDNAYYKDTCGMDYYYDIPEATSMELSYHRVMGYECDTVDEAYECAKKQVLECAKEGRHYVYIRMTSLDAYNEANEVIFKASGEQHRMMEILAEVNAEVGETFQESRWSRYGGHDENDEGPLTFIITLKDAE